MRYLNDRGQLWTYISLDGVMTWVGVGLDPIPTHVHVLPEAGRKIDTLKSIFSALESAGRITDQTLNIETGMISFDLLEEPSKFLRALEGQDVRMGVRLVGHTGDEKLARNVVEQIRPWVNENTRFIKNPEKTARMEWSARRWPLSKVVCYLLQCVNWRSTNPVFLRFVRRFGLPFFAVCLAFFCLLGVFHAASMATSVFGAVLSIACIGLIAYRTEGVS